MKTPDTKKVQTISRSVRLEGITPIMFDRYAGDNKTTLEPGQKMYFERGTKKLVIPALNVMSFFSAQNTPSAPKLLMDPRKYKKTAQIALAVTVITPDQIPLLGEKGQITFGKFETNDDGDELDPKSGIFTHRSVARLPAGIPNPKVRPVVPVPWAIEFKLSLFPTPDLTEEQLYNLFVQGGQLLGLGTFRGVFGKFRVADWS